MKIVTTKISTCVSCRYYVEIATFGGDEYCGLAERYFVRDQPIPNWCPLPNDHEEETWIAKIKSQLTSWTK